MKIMSIYLQNPSYDANVQQRIGVSHIRLGDDSTPFSTDNAKIVDNITDGGFFEASQFLSG